MTDTTPLSATASARRAAKQRKRRMLAVLEALGLIVVALLVMFPIAWMVMTAFKNPADVYRYTMWFTPTLDNFREVFGERWNIAKNIMNSSIIAVSTVCVAIPIAVSASYAFSRLRFPLKRTMFQWILLTQFIPAVTIVLPFYVMFRNLGMLDTYGALIIVDLSIVLPYAIWTIKGFIDAIPIEAEEAAIIDGASRFRVIWDIVVPMAWPGIMTAAIFCFILTWNEFLFGYLLSRQDVVPLPVGIISFVLERGPVWELIAATGIIITIPMFFFALMIQRHFTKGMNLGAVR
ncbi:MAG: carbohydrate ABC transporter permease [Paracoccaceae bacterium]